MSNAIRKMSSVLNFHFDFAILRLVNKCTWLFLFSENIAAFIRVCAEFCTWGRF